MTTAVGLTSAEVEQRKARGQVNIPPRSETRTLREIVRSNVLTRFNLLITALLVVILIVAPIQDALFGVVMVVNAAIGIIQELRAKRTLDRLTLLGSPRVRAVRDGSSREILSSEVVLDDLIELSSGDQLVADCIVAESAGLEVNEALLTGESDPVVKEPSDECLSGSFVVAGTGRCVVTAVGGDAFASRLTSEAQRFKPIRSQLREGIDWILGLIGWILPFTVALLVWSQVRADQSFREAMAGAVAGSVAAVPQGLVLLTSVAFAVGVIRLGRRQVLTRELAAVEGLARVDTICFDKTGTLTAGRLQLRSVEPVGGPDGRLSVDEIRETLGAIAATDPSPNATLGAIAAACPAPRGWTPKSAVPFSSARKWSGASFEHGSFVLGAPEVIAGFDQEVMRGAESYSVQGLRVLALARTATPPVQGPPPEDVSPIALVVLGDEIREDAQDIIDYFGAQGIESKVISGDHPRTVGAIAGAVGISRGAEALDGRGLPEDPEELARVMEETAVFGRVSPGQKRAMIGALQARGRVVAMTGDGVNDVLALKDADLGVAMGSGSSAARAVADVVLLRGDFGSLPDVVTEGRRVASNIERVSSLFLTKTIYAFLLAVAVAIVALAFPFLPRHLTLIGSLTIGIPAFFLALERDAPRARPGFVARALRFAVPTGAAAAAAAFLAYLLSTDEGVSVDEGRTVATIVLGAVGIVVLAMASLPLNRLRRNVLWGVGICFSLAFLVPASRDFFALDIPRPLLVLAAIGVVAITGSLLLLGLRVSGWATQAMERATKNGR